jgi:uncharacterized protein YbjT (DUF2867 family)
VKKTALIIGATGLVGNQLLGQLLSDDTFSKVKIFVRRSTGMIHDKLEEIMLDFDNIKAQKDKIKGDVLFSCLGSTIKQAGTKANQYKVDFTYQYEFAKVAAENAVPDYVLISATSASSKSMFFYSRIKGELEAAISTLDFKKIRIVQPSVLEGHRTEKRVAEEFGAIFINFLGRYIPALQKYRSIGGDTLARAMISIYKEDLPDRIKVYRLDELFRD